VAKVRLQGYGGPIEGLPEVCLRCGAPGTVFKRKTFSWFPGWIYVLLVTGLVPFLVVALVLTRRRTVEAPLCAEHKNHWLIRQLVVLLSFLFLIVVGLGTFVALGTFADEGGFDLVCFGWFILLIAWLILAAVMQMTAIRPIKITDTTITLVGVCDEFVQAYQEVLPRVPVDELVSEHWQQSRSRSSRPVRRAADESDQVQRPEEDKSRRTPPDDAYWEEKP
jgi:hypothetical protein